MIDSHTHLASCEPPDAELVAEAAQAGVHRLLTIGMDEQSNRQAIAAAREHEAVFAAVGRHPNAAEGFDDAAATDLRELAADPHVRAIGETGLDWYRTGAPPDDQHRAFSAQIALAAETGKPLVIHMRDSIADAYAKLDAEADGVTVVLHCFSGDAAQAAQATERGWVCSFAGNVTYPKAESLREAAREVPDELLLVETDAPYLAPQPLRGKRNRPACVTHTAEVVAEQRGVGYQALEQVVEANATRLFGW
ncbi:MAG: TatD family hydrolase [Solirubrobacterales bacterium]